MGKWLLSRKLRGNSKAGLQAICRPSSNLPDLNYCDFRRASTYYEESGDRVIAVIGTRKPVRCYVSTLIAERGVLMGLGGIMYSAITSQLRNFIQNRGQRFAHVFWGIDVKGAHSDRP